MTNSTATPFLMDVNNPICVDVSPNRRSIVVTFVLELPPRNAIAIDWIVITINNHFAVWNRCIH
jgi:hypothetical protein